MNPQRDGTIHFRFLGGKGTFDAGRSPWLYGMCLLLGLPFVYVLLVHAPVKWVRARGWLETPCTIVSSTMALQSTNYPRYRERVVYEYTVDGKHYRSDSRTILPFFSSRYREPSETRLQARYPSGSRSVCYVNPRDPSECLLDRELHLGEFLYLPFVLLITGVGVYGLWRRSRGTPSLPANDVP